VWDPGSCLASRRSSQRLKRGVSLWWSDVSLLGTAVESQSDCVPLRIWYHSLFQASDQCLDKVEDMGN
ncbi:hypothetical protein A2U01_0057569, partial [Trifolium medium]|nr:hypothetical protein [Trifolium medium]